MERKRIFSELKSTEIFPQLDEMDGAMLESMSLLTINKVPCGQYLIREGETPRALFYLSRGIIRKLFNVNGN